MPRAATDDLTLLTERLRLGIPLTGFDGRTIPLVDPAGRVVDPIEAAEALLLSGATLLPPEDSARFIDAAIQRASLTEAVAAMTGEPDRDAVAKVTGILVSAAVRASVLARWVDAAPSDLNRATLAWFQSHRMQARRLIDAEPAVAESRLTA